MKEAVSKVQGIKSWPVEDRPREKLLKKGAGALSNSELLAILLRTGTNGNSAVELARQVLQKFGTFRNMVHADAQAWKEFKGLGSAKVVHIKAALEIGRRYREDELSTRKQKITSVKDVVDLLMPQMRDLKTELFKLVCLDSSNRVIDIGDVACGTVNRATPIVREIIHSVLQKFAASIICVHNHPSGDSNPSIEDRNFTRELCQATKIMQIRMLDHLIIGDNQYYSFSASGELVTYK